MNNLLCLLLTLLAMKAVGSDYEILEFKDIVRLVQRDDGLYNAICIDGSIEIGVSYEEIINDEVCNGDGIPGPGDPPQELIEEQFTQINRPIETVTKMQGHNGDTATEHFAIADVGVVDLLIVMDDSSSMDQYQDRITDNIPSLLAHIGNTNWRIAVTSTSSSCKVETGLTGEDDPERVEILTKAIYDNDPVQAQEILGRLLNKSTLMYQEEGIRTGTDALQGICNGVTTPWLRPSASIAMLIITDEENCGSGSGYDEPGCAGMPYETAEYFTDIYGTEPTVHGLLLLNDPPVSAVECHDSGFYEDPPNPANYIDLITRTGGVYADICTADYSSVFEYISHTISNQLDVQFELFYEPYGDLTVDIDGSPVLNYTIDGKTLTILDPLDTSAVYLNVAYTHSPVPITDSFSLEQAIDPSTLSVKINDTLIESNSYSYDVSTQTVTFLSEPPHRASIDFIFRPDTALIEVFSLSGYPDPSTIEVLVNDLEVSFVYLEDSNEIQITPAPLDGSTITVTYYEL